MIHTKELRSGNKVKTRRGEVITVQQLLCNTLVYDSQAALNREAINVRKPCQANYFTQLNEAIKEVEYNEIEPIALTPEILKKCGFRNFLREEWIFSVGSKHIDFEFIDEELRLRSPAPSFAKIAYLHQLQNLLYAISAHELKVDLE